MSVSIIAGGSSDLLTIDPTSKAARVTLYNTDGTSVTDASRPSFVTPIYIRFSGATAATSYIYVIRNGASKALRINALELNLTFDGTAAASTTRYRIERVTGVTATSGTGSTVLVPGRKDAALASSTATEVRQADGSTNALTLTSGSIADILHEGGVQRQVNAVAKLQYRMMPNVDPTIIAAGTGNCLAVKIVNAAVIGDAISGWIEWAEV